MMEITQLADFSDFGLRKICCNCMKQIDDSYLLKVDLTEGHQARIQYRQPGGWSQLDHQIADQCKNNKVK